MHTKTKLEAAEALLGQDHSTHIPQTELVRAVSYQRSPTSIRLSSALLKALDRMAAAEDRSRGNLIQHVLWEYIRECDGRRGDTLVRTLRKTYGDEFLSGFRGDAKLGTVLKKTGTESLSQLVNEYRRK